MLSFFVDSQWYFVCLSPTFWFCSWRFGIHPWTNCFALTVTRIFMLYLTKNDWRHQNNASLNDQGLFQELKLEINPVILANYSWNLFKSLVDVRRFISWCNPGHWLLLFWLLPIEKLACLASIHFKLWIKQETSLKTVNKT